MSIFEIPIKAIALDVDGVLTDGTFWWGPDGQEWKRFSFRDVMGISRAQKAGILFALISGEDTPLVDRFAKKMNIASVFKGCKDKAQALQQFATQQGLSFRRSPSWATMSANLGAMQLAGLAAAPSNAHISVLEKCVFVAKARWQRWRSPRIDRSRPVAPPPEMSRLIGIMQGRLGPPLHGRIQSFPVGIWQAEFPRAEEAGLQAIEWIYDVEDAGCNPICTDAGIAEIKQLSKKHGIIVQSLCADYFMPFPFVRATKEDWETRLKKFEWLMAQCHKAGIRDVVRQFVDNSRIDTPQDQADVLRLFQAIDKHWSASIFKCIWKRRSARRIFVRSSTQIGSRPRPGQLRFRQQRVARLFVRSGVERLMDIWLAASTSRTASKAEPPSRSAPAMRISTPWPVI